MTTTTQTGVGLRIFAAVAAIPYALAMLTVTAGAVAFGFLARAVDRMRDADPDMSIW